MPEAKEITIGIFLELFAATHEVRTISGIISGVTHVVNKHKIWVHHHLVNSEPLRSNFRSNMMRSADEKMMHPSIRHRLLFSGI